MCNSLSTFILIFLPFWQENLSIKNTACPHQGHHRMGDGTHIIIDIKPMTGVKWERL
jgi:hypothetical protein